LLPIAAITATTTDSAPGLGASALLIVPIAILVLWIGLGYLWNHRHRPKKQKAGVATASFNNILGRVLKFVLKEDNFPNKKIKNPKLAKFLTWRNIYLILAAIAIILSLAGNSASAMFTIILLVVIAARTRKVFVARHSVLMRMFEVAAFELKYPRDANLNPWSWVKVAKWENLTVPGETQVAFPAAYKSEDFKNRENFERHFNGTVTDDNTWLYKWKSSESNVLCSPVTHIPELAKYPGSANRKPNEIPIGVGADGEIVWDINVVPHALVTGTTGGGKSTIQRNLIFHCVQHPNDWRFLGIDVKRVELKPYLKYDPVVVGIATTLEDGVEICRYARDEMMDRYEKMEELGVNHYHDLPDKPFALMLMVDETYMFLAPSGIKTDEGKLEDELKGEASKILGDIARLGRASGVHLVLATQRPDAKVIYGELKQNLAARIAAGRMDSIASNMTLDNDNATRLPGNVKGRGFFQAFGEGEQFQGYFAPQDWVDNWLIEQENKENNAEHFDNGAVVKEKPKKSLFGKKGDTKSIEAASDDGPVEKASAPRKKGLLGKIQAYNEAQAASAEGDAPEKAIPKESIPTKKASPKKEKPVVASEPKEPSLLISPTDDSHDSDASILNSIKDEFEDDDFADPFGNEAPVDFGDMEDIDFGDITSSGPVPILTGNSAFDFDDEEFELVAGGDTAPVKNNDPVKIIPTPARPAPVTERTQRPVSKATAPTPAPVTKTETKAPAAPPNAVASTPTTPVKKKGLPALPPRPKLPGQ
jgi:hypothetical protein